MGTMFRTCLGVGIFTMLVGPAMAANGDGPFLALLSNASVHEELKLDAGQIDKAKQVAALARQDLTTARHSLQRLDGEEQAKKGRERTAKIYADAHKAVNEFMKPEQVKRLNEITHQVQGAKAFTDEQVQRHLKLTDVQKSDIEEINRQEMHEMRSIFQDNRGDPEGAMKKMADLHKQTLSKAEAKLTPTQLESWKNLCGAPFEIKYERRSP
jgi:hypothetical protein